LRRGCAALGGHIAALEGQARRTPLRASPSPLEYPDVMAQEILAAAH
jgi:hypothetical protein